MSDLAGGRPCCSSSPLLLDPLYKTGVSLSTGVKTMLS